MSKEKKPITGQIQIECRNENEWRSLCKREGLIVVNIYAGWAGACLSINNFLKKIKQDVDSPKLILATACSDNIEELHKFRNQSIPTWLFLAGGGKPVKLLRGAHILHLAKAIKEEHEQELQCMEGKARRNFISLEEEATMEGEAHQ